MERRSFLSALAIAPVVIAAPSLVQAASPRVTWDRLVADYLRANAAASAHPYGRTRPDDPLYDAMSNEHGELLGEACRRLDAVMEFPVSDNAMLAEKLEIAVKEFGDDDWLDSILGDARRLV